MHLDYYAIARKQRYIYFSSVLCRSLKSKNSRGMTVTRVLGVILNSDVFPVMLLKSTFTYFKRVNV